MFETPLMKFPDDPEILIEPIKEALSAGRYERDELENLRQFITKRDRVLEIGAGIGFISTQLRLQHGVRKITCVEANPALSAYISRVHKANGIEDIPVLNTVLVPDTFHYEQGDTIPFYITDPFWSSSINKPGDYTYTRTVDVPVHSLTRMVARRKPTTLICDIEGAEDFLFQSVYMPTVKKVFMEIHQSRLRGAGIYRVFHHMMQNGFFYDCRASRNAVVLFRRLGRKDLNTLRQSGGPLPYGAGHTVV